MTKAERIAVVQTLTGETDENILSVFLDMAAERIWEKCFPFKPPDGTDIPLKYHFLQTEIAVYLYNKRGAEGETRHDENGIARSYESASVPDSMLKNVVPFCGTLAAEEGSGA